jgi:hypothetical protein
MKCPSWQLELKKIENVYIALKRFDEKIKFQLYACKNRNCSEYQKLVLRNLDTDEIAELALIIRNIENMELFDE